jgi:Flp pilus assembly protein TadD
MNQPAPGAGLGRLPAPLVAGGVPAVVAAAVAANTLLNGFVYDDAMVFGQLGGGWAQWRELALPSGSLAYSVHAADYWLWGDWAPGFRLTNLVLHAMASFLAAYLALLVTRSTRIGAICGLLFAVHPVHMEAVASFANRDQILAMIFVCFALALWLDPARRSSRYLGALACFVLSFAAAPVTAAGVVPMLFVADLLVRRDAGSSRGGLKSAALRSAPLWLLTAGVTYGLAGNLSRFFEPSSIFQETEGIAGSYLEVLATSAAAVPELFRLLFFPHVLSADHPVRVQTGFADTHALIGIVVLVAWLAASGVLRRRAPVATFAMIWVVVTDLPHSNLIPFTNYFVAERFLYVPSFGACLLIAFAFDAAFRSTLCTRRSALRWALVGVLALGTLAAATRSVQRNRDWQSSESLATSALTSGMDTWRMRRMLAQVNSQRGDFSQASFNLRRAVELAPMFPELQLELAIALLYEGRMIQAAGQIDLANARGPSGTWAAAASQNLGVALALQGFPQAAVDQYYRALEIQPDNANAHHNLAVALAAQGNLREAISHYGRTLELEPSRADAHHNLGIALMANGEPEQAIRHYRQALERAPERPGVHHALAIALAFQHRTKDAIEHYRRALEQEPRDADAHHNLAVALAAEGELAEAVQHYREALALDPGRPDAMRNLEVTLGFQTARAAGQAQQPTLSPASPALESADLHDAYYERGLALASQGSMAEATQQYRQALALEPDDADVHYALGIALELLHRDTEAVLHYRQALREAATRADVHNSLAWILATSPSADVRRPDEAIRLAERAASLTEAPDPNHLDTLAAAYASASRFEDAVRTAEQAFLLAASAQSDELAAEIHGRLHLYRGGNPYLETAQTRDGSRARAPGAAPAR